MPKVLLKKQHFKQEIKVSCVPAAAMIVLNYLEKDKIPVIAFVDTSPLNYWKLSAAHVLVIVGFDEENIIVNDPFFEKQEIKIPITIFMEAWSVFQNLLIIIKKR